jgi:hypothetical protein
VSVTSTQLDPPQFIDLILAPHARPIDADLLSAEAAKEAWARLKAWASSPRAFCSAAGVAAGGTKR